MNFHSFSLRAKVIIFFVNFFTLLFIGLAQYSTQYDSLKEEFNFNVENIVVKQLSSDISSTKGIITTLASFYHTTNEMNTSTFSNFSKDLISKYNFIKSISFASIVNNSERENFEQTIQDEGLYSFVIKSINKDTLKFERSDYKEQYAPIIYIEPDTYRYTRYYGFDIYNNHLFNNAFVSSARNNSIEIKDRLINDRNELMNIFIKATYSDVEERKVNGFFLIDVDFNKIIDRIKKRFSNYHIEILNKKEYEEYSSKSISNNKMILNDLDYFVKVDDFPNSFLYIKKEISFLDFNLKIFFIILFLVVIIQILYVITWQKDRTAKKKLNYRASHDDLTGLINRLYFRKTFEKKIKKSKNQNKVTAILFIDLDRFKEVNDSFGHKFGDEVLIEISNRFKEVMRNNDTICRHGGDEFIILVDGIKDLKDLVEIVKKIMNSMNKPINFNNQKIHLTLSIGISLYPNDGNSIDDLLKNADSALYKAKDEGRNTYRFYTEDMTLEVMQKVVLENKLREAIEQDEFVVFYQPQIDGRDDSLVGMEALVRWKDKNGSLVPPSKFIPLAEETGLIVKLDQLIMRKAIKQFSIWKKRGLNPVSLSLNLSMKQLKSDNFISILKETLLTNSCDANLIELEVTEGQIMENPLEAIEKLKEISSLGIRLSVDDFGTGYSSLAYLKKLPINKLKIDRAFVMDLPDDEEDIAISKSVIALAQNLKLDVIAEGVETIEQREFLVKNGCFKIQGYFYSKPLSCDDLEKLLRK